MYWQQRFNRENPDKELEEAILSIREVHKDFGYRRIQSELKKQEIFVNKKKIQRIIRKLGIQVTSYTRKSRRYSSYKGNVGKVSPNRLHRRFATNVPHQKITTDTTEFKYYPIDENGNVKVQKLYFDPFMDMYNSEILSYGISKAPSSESILKALNQAILITSDCKYRRTFHSDQGWAYQMNEYGRELRKAGIFQSMSRKGNCFDNSIMKNFFGIMKQEMYHGNTYHSYEELSDAIENYINYYNEKRIKERLNFMSPIEYRTHNVA